MPKKKLRFDLFAILEWTAALAIAFALISGSNQTATWLWRFATLPADDSALGAWLTENGHVGVTVERTSDSIRIEKRIRALPGGPLTLPLAPWEELGYMSPSPVGGSSGWTVFGGSAYPWIVGFGILAAMSFVRRRYIKSSRTAE